MTQWVVNIKKQTDLEKLLSFLKRRGIAFTQTEDNLAIVEKNTLNTERG